MSRTGWLAAVMAMALGAPPAWAAAGAALATVQVQGSAAGGNAVSLDAVVEAERQTTLSAQVAGAIVALNVKAGDSVKAGQPLVRIDARAASQNAAASAAQVDAARAALKVAATEYQRQQLLFQKQYISQSALDRARAQYESAQAQVQAQQAQARAAQAESGFFVLSAPYDGVVSDVPVTLGDMAMPGRALLTLHDPSALRVTAAVPQTVLAALADSRDIRFELPGYAAAPGRLQPARVQVLPVVDAATHTGQVRLALPAGLKGVVPGMFARVWLPAAAAGAGAPGAERLYLPASAVVRRAEMTGVYVLNAQGRPLLRQVRLGPVQGERVEILSGVGKGDTVALDPQAAARAP
ncbi:efflux RND transporter periplasmic adaptor subunit [Caenimonas terrae]|uniref:Efflux RND transporter periplasmic adaptor subunit n=1 Tax=Caenimonas terrae TaxID=696074 RepID=A0ABW0NFN3_9BURK